jgi:hypothetical protein
MNADLIRVHLRNLRLKLDDSGITAYSQHRMSRNAYRYYYYYGPLSAGRDGQAMGCRRALTM